MTTTFHRTPTKTGVIIFESRTGSYDWVPLKLPQLIRKTVENEDEMVKTDFDHTIYELTGDISKLSKASKPNPLLDKKVVKRVVDAKIDFSKTDSLEGELLLYLKEVKGIDKSDSIVSTFNDYI